MSLRSTAVLIAGILVNGVLLPALVEAQCVKCYFGTCRWGPWADGASGCAIDPLSGYCFMFEPACGEAETEFAADGSLVATPASKMSASRAELGSHLENTEALYCPTGAPVAVRPADIPDLRASLRSLKV